MYDVSCILLNGIESMYVNSLVKGCESKCFGIGSGERRVYRVSLAFQCIYGCSDERGENVDWEEGREWRLPGLWCADDLVLWGESEEDLSTMVGCLVEVGRRRGLKVNAGKSKVMMIGGEEGLDCEDCVEGM